MQNRTTSLHLYFLNSKNKNMRWKEEIAINHKNEGVVGEREKESIKLSLREKSGRLVILSMKLFSVFP